MKNPSPVKKKTPISKMILYTVLVLEVYLLARAFIFVELSTTTFAAGIIIGLVFGSYYQIYKIREVQVEMKQETTV